MEVAVRFPDTLTADGWVLSAALSQQFEAWRRGPSGGTTRERERRGRSGERSRPHPAEPFAGGRRPDRLLRGSEGMVAVQGLEPRTQRI